MIDNGKRRKRIKTTPDINLLNMLNNGDQSVLQLILSNPTLAGLSAIEETITLYSGNEDSTFYILGGQRVYTSEASASAHEEIIDLALNDALLSDPAFTQSLIASLGTSGLSNLIMTQLSGQALFSYQLLGVQMQLSYLLRDQIKNTQEKNEEIEEIINAPINQETKEHSEEQKKIQETISETKNVLEKNMQSVIEMIGQSAETANKKEIVSIMKSLAEHKNNINLSPETRELAKNTRLFVIGIMMRKFPELLYLADEGEKHTIPSYQYKNTSLKSTKEKAIRLAFVTGFVTIVYTILSFMIFLISDKNSDVPSLFLLLLLSIFMLIPLGIAFIARKNIKTAGILFVVYGAFGMISALSALFSGTVIGVLSFLLQVLYIVAGVRCVKASNS